MKIKVCKIPTFDIRLPTFFLNPLFLILLLSLLLRLPLLNGSFWLDEAAQANESLRPLSQQLNITADFQPPLMHLIVHFASYFSHSEWWLRLWGALLPGLVTIWASFKIAEKLFSKKTAILTGLLLATSSFHIFYSQELRPYSLPTMFACLSWLLLLRNSPSDVRHSKTKILPSTFYLLPSNYLLPSTFYLLLSLLGLYSSYLYPFLLISQFIYLIIKKYDLKKLFLTGLAITLGFLPWLPMFFKQLSAGQALRTQLPNWETVVSIPQLKSLPLVFGKFIYGVLDIKISIFFIIATLILFYLIIKLFIKANYKKNYLIYIWLLVPLITSWIVSFWVPVVQPKRVLFLLPAFYLFLSSLVFENTKFKKAGYLLILILFFISFYSTTSYFLNPKLQRENWRDLNQEITTKFQDKKTVVIFSSPGPFAPWTFYDQDKMPWLATGTHYIDQESLSNNFKTVLDYEYVLVFDYLRDLSDPENRILETIENFGYTHIGVFDYPNIGFVRIYISDNKIKG